MVSAIQGKQRNQLLRQTGIFLRHREVCESAQQKLQEEFNHSAKAKKNLEEKLKLASQEARKTKEDMEASEKERASAENLIKNLHDALEIKDNNVNTLLEREQGLKTELTEAKEIARLKKQLADKPIGASVEEFKNTREHSDLSLDLCKYWNETITSYLIERGTLSEEVVAFLEPMDALLAAPRKDPRLEFDEDMKQFLYEENCKSFDSR